MNRKLIIGLAAAAFAVLAVVWAVSPLIAVRGLIDASKRGDAAALERKVDFPAFRDSLKNELNARLRQELRRDLTEGDNALSGLGLVLAPAIVSGAVDAFVTPDAIAAMVVNAEAPDPETGPPEPQRDQGGDDDIRQSYAYRGLNTFAVTLIDPDHADEPLDLILERRGLFSWKLAGIDLRDEPEPGA